ncbi:MAG: metallophosphoesterase [Oscillospiraceae bacterium]|nr:metallophosphoesterase [Oscillospiraceae bacterium]
MKRLLVLSDSHGSATDLAAICALHPEADRIVFLGDGEEDIELLQLSFPELKPLSVRGNNDFYSSHPYEDVLVLGGARIFYTHGHRYGVKGGLARLAAEAKSRGCGIALYGHTHEARCDKIDGVYLINPGAVLSWPARYALVDITDEGYPIVSHCKAK